MEVSFSSSSKILNREGQDGTGLDRAGQDRTGQARPGQDRTGKKRKRKGKEERKLLWLPCREQTEV